MSKKPKNFVPKIVAFICNWSACAETDLNELNQLQNPPSIRIVKLVCSGRIQPAFILDAFNHGSDGVIVCGCKLGDCHYMTGNEKAKNRIEKTNRMLEILGIAPERLKFALGSLNNGINFVDLIKNFSDQLLSLGAIEIENYERN